tara:strand:- start:1116 stop:1286 length:171 start_codon:yes stop_codon:yes gene_type:complete
MIIRSPWAYVASPEKMKMNNRSRGLSSFLIISVGLDFYVKMLVSKIINKNLPVKEI